MVLGSGRDLAQTKCPHLPAEGLLGDREAVLLIESRGQVEQAPADHAVDRGCRASLRHAQELLTPLVVELRRLTGRRAVDQPGRARGVETQNPVAQGLQTDTADPGRLAAAAAS